MNLDKYYTDKIGNENVAKELAGAKFQLKNSAGSVLWFIPVQTATTPISPHTGFRNYLLHGRSLHDGSRSWNYWRFMLKSALRL